MIPGATIKTSGSIEDVAAFFCVSPRTVHDWKNENPPRLMSFQEGRNICFGEEAVVEFRVKGSRHARRMVPGEAEEIARREWREHLKIRDQKSESRNDLRELFAAMEEMKGRLDKIEKHLTADRTDIARAA